MDARSILIFFALFLLAGCGSPTLSSQKLENGIQLVAIPIQNAPVISLQAWFHVGARHEQPGWEGVSHFLEHLLFKRDKDAYGRTLAQRVEVLGGEFNAATSHDYTYFYITLPPEHFSEGLLLLREALREPTFTEEAFMQEKKVVLAEMDQRRDDPWTQVFQKLYANLYYGHPYSREVIGTEKSVAALTHLQVAEYYHTNYLPERLTIVMAGPVAKDKMTDKARMAFQDFPKNPLFLARVQSPPLPIKKSGWEVEKSRVSLEYFADAFLGPNAENLDGVTLDVTATVLGGGRSSRLYQSLVEQKKIAHNVEVGFYAQKDAGAFIISGTCAPENHHKLIEAIKAVVGTLKNNPPTANEVARAKKIIEADYLRSRETPVRYATEIGSWSVLSKIEDAEEYLRRVSKVTPTQIQQVAEKYFSKMRGISLVPKE